MSKSKKMTPEAAARIEKAGADKNRGQTPADSFESRAKKAAAKNKSKGGH